LWTAPPDGQGHVRALPGIVSCAWKKTLGFYEYDGLIGLGNSAIPR